MRKYIFLSITLLLFSAAKVGAQEDYNERARKYIDQYSKLAIEEQRRSGIPAAITLGQGILETEAGISELATEANNHFGIKCKSEWHGEVFLHTDDAPNERFKKYKSAAESYKDHSDHLKRNARYAPLFKLKETDYASWAVCLRKCGYATNPKYAQKLIKIIEDFKLQEYTYSAIDSDAFAKYTVVPVGYTIPNPDTNKKLLAAGNTITEAKPPARISKIKVIADSARQAILHKYEVVFTDTIISENGNLIMVNGLKAFYAGKGEQLQKYADKYHVPYPQLLLLNDLPDAPLPFDMNVYLEKKLTTGTHPVHIITQGETLLMIAQQESIQLQCLMSLNLLNPKEEPAEGSILELQKKAGQKPGVKISAMAAHNSNAIISGDDTVVKSGSGYIATHESSQASQIDSPKFNPVSRPVVAPTPVAVSKPAPPKPVVAAPKPEKRNQWEMSDEEIQEQSTRRAEFAKLKAELDKIVYADDSKLTPQAGITPPPQNKTVAPEPATSAKNNKYYTVRKGDTAFSIANKHNITVSQLLQWNNIESRDIKEGQSLQVKEK